MITIYDDRVSVIAMIDEKKDNLFSRYVETRMPGMEHVTNAGEKYRKIFTKAINESGLRNDMTIDNAYYVSNNTIIENGNAFGVYAKKGIDITEYEKLKEKYYKEFNTAEKEIKRKVAKYNEYQKEMKHLQI